MKNITVLGAALVGLAIDNHPGNLKRLPDEIRTIQLDVVKQWALYDEYDKVNNIHSMARTTGYAATAVVRCLAVGGMEGKGLFTPEELSVNPKLVGKILAELRAKNVVFTKSTAGKA